MLKLESFMCSNDSCRQFYYTGQERNCPVCNAPGTKLKFDAANKNHDLEIYIDPQGIRWQLKDYKLQKLPKDLQAWPLDPRRSVPSTWWPAAALVILAMILAPGSRILAQSQPYTASYVAPFTIQTVDSNYKEIGFFKFDPVKKQITSRGNQVSVFTFFHGQVLVPQQNIWSAADSVLMYVNDIGQITDTVKFRAAAARYYIRRNKPY